MNKKIRKAALLLIVGFIPFPLGCEAQDRDADAESRRIELVLRVDGTPLEREEGSGVVSYAQMLKRVQPAVVSVYSERLVDGRGLLDYPSLRRFFGEDDAPRDRTQQGVGSGVIVSPSGYVLTNNHVIEGAERIVVQLADEGQIEAEVIGTDGATDIAVLRLRSRDGEEFPFVVLADSSLVEVGDVVFALGNALGIGHAVTSGIVSARGRSGIGILGEEGYEDFIQTDASMNVGNSGGPLVDARGRVIGLNTAIASPGGGNVGIGFAIPINMARSVMRNLIEFGEVRRGYLGISLRNPAAVGMPVEFGAPSRDFTPRPDGALIVDVLGDSPAERAGLEEGDSVVELDGSEIRSGNDLRLKIAQTAPGSTVEIGVMRGDERIDLSAMLGDLGEAAEVRAEKLAGGDGLLPGLTVVPLTSDLREQFDLADELEGLLLTEVETDSLHADKFPVGGVITQVNRQAVRDLETARGSLRAGRNLFLLFHEGELHPVVIELEVD